MVERSPSMGGDRGLILGRNRPKSLKHVVRGSLPNARRQCECHGDNHYKGLISITVAVAR